MVQAGPMMLPIICIVGPTAVGKTSLSIELAKRFHAEIISADAMQFYRGLDIGTAKVTAIQQQNIPHHLIDILEPNASFSVAEYQQIVRDKITQLHNRNILPILVGGSGLYVQSVIYDYRFDGEKRRPETTAAFDSLTNEELHAKLLSLDPLAGETTHPHNRKRVIRLLELLQTKANLRPCEGKKPYYDDIIVIGLEVPRKELYERIEKRVDKMVSDGLIEEVSSLYAANVRGQSVMAIGYKELFAALEGKTTFSRAIELIKQSSRRYAKRQLTWFKNQMEAVWFTADFTDFAQTVETIVLYLDHRINH
jgi:tRNA dimethylallyltransferase